LAVVFNVQIAAKRQGHRGEANGAHKVAKYLVKSLCDLTLQEMAAHFEVKSMGW